jgi:hypothetical protein
MWSDTLLALERAHLLRLLAWGAMSVVAGTGVLASLMLRRADSSLLRGFAIQTSAWGIVDLALAGRGLFRITDRDLGAAIQLDRLLWLAMGLDIGIVCVGIALAVMGWSFGRRLGVVGAGIAIVLQGLALFVLDLRFVSMTARMF